MAVLRCWLTAGVVGLAPAGSCGWLRQSLLLGLTLLAGLLAQGCAALTNPVSQGIPARKVPEELLAAPKNGLKSVPLNLLGQAPPAAYQLAAGDVLAVFIETILGERNLPLPTFVPLLQDVSQPRLPASTGYPVPIEADGNINLPLVGPLQVCGMTVAQARDAIIELYVKQDLLKRDKDGTLNERVLISLLQPRRYPVQVFRQEANGFSQGQFGVLPSTKRGTGFTLELPAYENDVLHALLRSGGLPGLDACNEVLIHRNALLPSGHEPLVERGGQVVRIPLRLPPGAPLPVKPQDVVLGAGDVVYVEARDQEVYFTGGLIPPGQYPLPHDRDLDVIEAISFARGPLLNGSFAVSNLSGTLIQPGIGNPNPTRVTVVRRTPSGGQVPIIVDLAKALCDPSERILIKGGDLIILQETPGQAMTRYLTQTFFNFDMVWQAFHSKFVTGVVDVAGPDRLQSHISSVNIVQPGQ